jgi:hypothetical protein
MAGILTSRRACGPPPIDARERFPSGLLGSFPMWFIELAQDFLYFLKERKAWWLTPIVVVLLLLTVLILVGEKAAVLPFIYTLF